MKKIALFLGLDAVFLAVFNILFFMLGGTEHPASVWISYGFIHLSYIMILLTPVLTRKSSSAAIFSFFLHWISVAYFFVEFFIGIIFILIRSDSHMPATVVQIIITGIYAAVLLANMVANEYTADDIANHESEVAFIKKASSEIKPLLDKLDDKKASKEIEKLYDLIHSSPSKSTPEAKALENDIIFLIQNLESAVQSNNTEKAMSVAKNITETVVKRNGIIKQ